LRRWRGVVVAVCKCLLGRESVVKLLEQVEEANGTRREDGLQGFLGQVEHMAAVAFSGAIA